MAGQTVGIYLAPQPDGTLRRLLAGDRVCPRLCMQESKSVVFTGHAYPVDGGLSPPGPLYRSPGSAESSIQLPAGNSVQWLPSNAACSREKCWTRRRDRKSTRLNSSHRCISYAVFCLKKKT